MRTLTNALIVATALATSPARAEDPASPPPTPPPGAAAPAAGAPDPALQARLDALEARLAAAEKAAKPPEKPAKADAPAVKLGGYVHADGRVFLDDGAQKRTDDILLRRVRPDVSVRVGDFAGRILVDFGGGKTVLQDAYVEARHLSLARLRAGKFKAPVGLERLQGANSILFVERALPTNLVPNRDVGVQLSGDLVNTLSYAIGVFDGAPDGGAIDGDTSDDKDVAGRVFVRPFARAGLPLLAGLGVGAAGTYGAAGGDPAKTTELAPYKSDGQATFFEYRAGKTPDATNTVAAQGRRSRWTGQASWYAGPVTVLGEYVVSEQRVILNGESARPRNVAWQAAAAVNVTGEAASEDVLVPRVPAGKGGFGAVQLAARYAELKVDGDAFPTFADPARSARRARAVTGGVSWWPVAAVRLEVNYARTAFSGGAGTSTAVEDRPTEQTILSRAQLVF
jgi:phosphate-selective porin OprO/OprP